MSKGGGVSGSNINVGIEDLLAMNPELIEQLATEPAAQTSAPVEQAAPIPFYGSGNEISQPDQTYFDSFSPGENFYGSGTEITQPDADYYNQFPLPGQAPAQTQAPRTSTPIPIFDIQESSFDNTAGIGGEGGAGGMTYDPVIFADGAQRGPVNSAPVYGRQGLVSEPAIDYGIGGESAAPITPSAPVYGRRGINPSMPILDAAEEDEEIAYYTPRFNNFHIGAM